MATDNATLQVPNDVLQPIIEAHVAGAIMTALGGREELLKKAVAQALSVKVDENGKMNNYSSSIPWLQWAMGKAIRDAAKDAITAEITKQEPLIRQQIASELAKKNSPLVRQMIAGIVGQMSGEGLKYRLTVEVK